MNDDTDLYPHDSSYFQITEPDEQIEERRTQKGKSQAGKAIIEDLISKVSADIDAMISPDAIRVTPETTDEQWKMAHYGVQERLAYAREIKSHLESLLLDTRR